MRYTLAAHGWHLHSTKENPTPFIHSLFQKMLPSILIGSTRHLKTNEQITPMVYSKELPIPSLYVPPAWALGAIDKIPYLRLH